MVKRPYIYFLIFTFISLGICDLRAQNTAVISSAGESNQQNQVVISWSLGETVVSSNTNDKSPTTQGFHQTFSIDSVIELPDFPVFIVYPNPTTSVINLRAEKSTTFPVHIILSDASGKVIMKETMRSIQYHKDLHQFESGLYILTLINHKNETIKSYKIIKH